jgi:hypothetical protein
MTHDAHDTVTSNVLVLTAQTANMVADEEVGADVDEPPDPLRVASATENDFKRTTISRPQDYKLSLLTKAFQHSDDDTADTRPTLSECGRRRSMTSNISLASTADLTSDTGFTSPSRANTPSPPLPEFKFLQLNDKLVDSKTHVVPVVKPPITVVEPAPRKRCISFACLGKPGVNAAQTRPVQPAQPAQPVPTVKLPSNNDAPRKPCIRFACQAPRTASTQSTPPQRSGVNATLLQLVISDRESSPSTVRKNRSPSSGQSRSPRPGSSRRVTSSPTPNLSNRSKKYLTANSKDLLNESSRFHEFASDEVQEDDWIRQDASTLRSKLTINDTLVKENAIRRLAKEVEEEDEQEEDESKTVVDDDDDEDDDDLDALEDDEDEGQEYDDEDEEEDEDEDDFGSDEDGNSDGYHTDEETGFAESDEEDDGLHLWVPSQPAQRLSGESTVLRRSSFGEQQSDSSAASYRATMGTRRTRTRRIKIRPGTPELPDSTDFVCGTLDEDRPMEDAYISCLAARKREKLHVIPQDIDPSFPASEPENEEEEERYNPVHHGSDEDVWVHGEMEDLHHEQERSRRKKKGERLSPSRRYRSPPPKTRGRSPRRLFDMHSPRRLKSPPPQHHMLKSPPASPRNGHVTFACRDLASRPGLTQTKSLPRPSAMFPHMRQKRGKTRTTDVHVREAIDIVKGLEQKRQRRKEKFYQKYCNRARKGQIPERKPLPGHGAERMRELGLLMAGKIDQGNYVLSV